MAQLGLYGGTVTAGATDGALLSTANPLKYAGEKGALGDPVAYALRCPRFTLLIQNKIKYPAIKKQHKYGQKRR